jgi:hypothetical protein
MGCDYGRSFGLMIGIIGLFDTARDYTLRFTITHTYTKVSTVTSSLAVARQQAPTAASGFPNFPRPQLPASHSNNSQHLTSAVL